ncbi:condensation domain-containing protein [Kineosporia sp. NBRC 101731]|uniref:condensation domain-containing protein n=1 Tax=Kineosporia sp. NBRC 101731 TaxID=3032199 RepID=UPI00249F9E74|nr:condensation domain-containing protein [Kineosporia sp. NBRC 101731]GLY30845.1 hypothetical protein Kisp02_42100 [Kineosporia sp. NBRC 101731]
MRPQIHLATAAQTRLYTMPRRAHQDGSFNVVSRLKVTGPLDTDRLEHAVGAVVARHSALRTTFAWQGDQVVQVVHATAAPSVFRELSPTDPTLAAGPGPAADQLARHLIDGPLDLDHGPLFRCTVLRSGEDTFDVFLVLDHIIVDERSKAIIIDDLCASYADPDVDLGPAPQLHEFTDHGDEDPEGPDYWTSRLTPLPPRPFPDVRPEDQRTAFKARVCEVRLGELPSKRLDAMAAAHRATPFSALLTALLRSIWRVSGVPDLNVAVVTDLRSQEEEFDTVGFFQNSTVVRETVNPEHSFAQTMDRVKRSVAGAIAHRHVPVGHLVASLAGGYGDKRNPLYQIGFAYSNADTERRWVLPGLTVQNVELEPVDAQIEVFLEINRVAEGYVGKLIHAVGSVQPERADQIVRIFEELLERAADDPGRDDGVASAQNAGPAHRH